MNQSIYPIKSATADQYALGKSSNTFARLMCPSEAADATKSYPKDVQARVAGRWMLCGDISSEMFSLLKKVSTPHFPTRVTAFKTPAGHGYGVLTHQVHGYGYGLQSRFILCLNDPRVRDFLAATATEEVSFMFGDDNRGDALVIESPVKSKDFIPLLAIGHEASKEEQKASLLELPLVLKAVTNPLQVPSLVSGQTVRQVNVSFLLPSILDEGLRIAMRDGAVK